MPKIDRHPVFEAAPPAHLHTPECDRDGCGLRVRGGDERWSTPAMGLGGPGAWDLPVEGRLAHLSGDAMCDRVGDLRGTEGIMSTKTNSGLAHHTFSQWRVDGDRRVVAGEREWKEPTILSNIVAENYAEYERHSYGGSPPPERPRMLIGVDVFEGWEGGMHDVRGGTWCIAQSGHWWNYQHETTDDDWGSRDLTMQDVRDRLFRTIDSTPNLDWLLFTSTPENIAGMLPRGKPFYEREGLDEIKFDGITYVPPGVWLGVDIDDQATADARIPHLLRVPAAVRMVRYSGVGRVAFRKVPELNKLPGVHHLEGRGRAGIDWLIISGEVGPDARPCNLEHVRDAIRQAKAAGVKVWVERLGSCVVGLYHERLRLCGEEAIGTDCLVRWRFHDPHGADPTEWPADLRIREVPT